MAHIISFSSREEENINTRRGCPPIHLISFSTSKCRARMLTLLSLGWLIMKKESSLELSGELQWICFFFSFQRQCLGLKNDSYIDCHIVERDKRINCGTLLFNSRFVYFRITGETWPAIFFRILVSQIIFFIGLEYARIYFGTQGWSGE